MDLGIPNTYVVTRQHQLTFQYLIPLTDINASRFSFSCHVERTILFCLDKTLLW